MKVLKVAAWRWSGDDAPLLGASLAYYSLFSVTPLLVIAVAIAGIAFDTETVREGLNDRLSLELGRNAADALLDMMRKAARPSDGIVAAAFGFGALIAGAVTLFVQLRTALARVWKERAKRTPSGFWRVVRGYVLAAVMVIGAGILLLAMLAVSTVLASLRELGGAIPGSETVFRILDSLVSLGLTAAMVAAVFRLMSHFAWGPICAGSVVTAALYAAGKVLFGLYVEFSGITSGYGAAGALVVFLVWVYYTAQIFLFGAEVAAAAADDV
ncbi:MAG: YihY/virulence factor BrkB family protein [Rhodospirillaceae bacterium]|nr:YihY/virulence factor BrkB family protein [Rhodospirillaceae bacterium]